MKKYFNSLLTVAMTAALSFSIASCVDNIDNSTKPSDNPQEQASDAQEAKAQKFWSVVSQLVDVDEYTEDYEDKTFEPTYGIAMGTDTSTRYVFTNDAATAAERFADLVERDDIDENTQSYTVDDPDIGTFVYNKGTGRELATVGVRVKQIPSLKKIVYMPGAYANASFNHKAYYRFGDVVSRRIHDPTSLDDENDYYEYWICVRPSFGPEGKGDSHWVSLTDVTTANIKVISASNGRTYYLPTRIGTNKEQMQNLAEMLFAICHYDEWADNISNHHNGLKMFHDFSLSKANFHNANFWHNVNTAWQVLEIPQKIMNLDMMYLTRLTSSDEADNFLGSLHFLYYGYSWWTRTSWNCTLYEAVYENDLTRDSRRNMHKATYNNVTRDMREVDDLDCRNMGTRYKKYYNSFFGDDFPRWIIRHATGKELSSDHNYQVDEPIKGMTEVYRYYNNVARLSKAALKRERPEVTEGWVSRESIKTDNTQEEDDLLR